MNLSTFISTILKNNCTVYFQGIKRRVENRSNVYNTMVMISLSLLMALATISSSASNRRNERLYETNVENTEISHQAQNPQASSYHNNFVKNFDYVKTFTSDGKNYSIVFDDYREFNKNNTSIRVVRVMPWDRTKDSKLEDREIFLRELIIHGKDENSWMEVRGTTGCVWIGEKGYFYYKSLRVPDEIGDDLIHLISGNYKYKNETNLKYSFTDNPKLKEPEYVEGKHDIY